MKARKNGKWLWMVTLENGEQFTARFSTYQSAMNAMARTGAPGVYKLYQLVTRKTAYRVHALTISHQKVVSKISPDLPAGSGGGKDGINKRTSQAKDKSGEAGSEEARA